MPRVRIRYVVMMKSLSLLAVLLLGTIPGCADVAVPGETTEASPEVAVKSEAFTVGPCNSTLLLSQETNWVPNQWGPALQPGAFIDCGETSVCGQPFTESCRQCTRTGDAGYWDWKRDTFCSFGNSSSGQNAPPMAVYGRVSYRPNPGVFTYRYKCICSEGNYSCAWQ